MTGLSNGKHEITIYAWDDAGNVGASETVSFTVAEQEQFPTTIVVASVIPLAIACTGALTYFKKRKR